MEGVMNMDNFGERLRAMRMRKGYTQHQLADTLGVSVSAVGMYERGLRKPTPELLVRLSRLFSISTDYLLGIEKQPVSVEEMLKQIYDSLMESDGLTYNGMVLGKEDTKKFFDSMNIVANVILNERMRNSGE